MCTNYISWGEKINEVNIDFKLCFHVNIHIYMKYSTLNNGNKDWNDKVIMQKLNQNDMNLEIFVVNALDRFSCGMLCFNDSEEYNRCTIIHL